MPGSLPRHEIVNSLLVTGVEISTPLEMAPINEMFSVPFRLSVVQSYHTQGIPAACTQH